VSNATDTLVSIASSSTARRRYRQDHNIAPDAALQIGQVLKVRVNIATPTPTLSPPPRPPLGLPAPPHDDIGPHDLCTRSAADGWPFIARPAGLLFAREVAYPDLVPSASLAVLDDLAIEAQRAIAAQPADPEAAPASRWPTTCSTRPAIRNAGDYADPRKFGFEPGVARRMGLPIRPIRDFPGSGLAAAIAGGGVGLPGTLSSASAGLTGPVTLDPFHGGRRLNQDDCRNLALAALGSQRSSEPAGWPPRPRDIVARMLNNLRGPSTCRRGLAARHCGLNLPAGAQPDRPDHVRDLGVLHYLATTPFNKPRAVERLPRPSSRRADSPKLRRTPPPLGRVARLISRDGAPPRLLYGIKHVERALLRVAVGH